MEGLRAPSCSGGLHCWSSSSAFRARSDPLNDMRTLGYSSFQVTGALFAAPSPGAIFRAIMAAAGPAGNVEAGDSGACFRIAARRSAASENYSSSEDSSMPEPGSPRGPEPRALVLSSFPLLVGSRRRLHPHREELPGPSFQPRRGCGAREEQRRGVLPSRIARA